MSVALDYRLKSFLYFRVNNRTHTDFRRFLDNKYQWQRRGLEVLKSDQPLRRYFILVRKWDTKKIIRYSICGIWAKQYMGKQIVCQYKIL